jgi:hypothetical protein
MQVTESIIGRKETAVRIGKKFDGAGSTGIAAG